MAKRLTIEELNKVANDSKNWKAQHEAFGTHLPRNADAEVLCGIAHKMIRACEAWIGNWTDVLNDRKEELDKIRNEQVVSKAKVFVDYDDEQWQKVCDERARLRGELVAAKK